MRLRGADDKRIDDLAAQRGLEKFVAPGVRKPTQEILPCVNPR